VGCCGANKLLQSSFWDFIALAEIDGARRLRLQSSVEETLRIVQSGAFEKVELYVVFECAEGDDIPFLRPDCGIPLPFFAMPGTASGSIGNLPVVGPASQPVLQFVE
jgi:hypothetical protein